MTAVFTYASMKNLPFNRQKPESRSQLRGGWPSEKIHQVERERERKRQRTKSDRQNEGSGSHSSDSLRTTSKPEFWDCDVSVGLWGIISPLTDDGA